MKLKYFMRGLGLGIILTTLIIAISNPQGKLSDDQIRDRAKKLGMVMKNDNKSDLDKALEDMNLTLTPKPSPTAKPTNAPSTKPTEKPSVEPTKAPEKESSSKNTNTKQLEQSRKIQFTIQKGMSSGKVAKLLVEKGLIKDADAFNQYIINLKKAGLIKVGSFSVSQNATYDNIIKEITYDSKK